MYSSISAYTLFQRKMQYTTCKERIETLSWMHYNVEV